MTHTTPAGERARLSEEQQVIAALYVENGGVYSGLTGVDPWDEDRDARRYVGPETNREDIRARVSQAAAWINEIVPRSPLR